MKRLLFSTIIIFSTCQFAFAQQEASTRDGKKVLLYDDGTWISADSVPLYNLRATTLDKLEIPKTNPKDIIIEHTGYSLFYNETHEQANWVAYVLTREETNKQFERTNKYIVDPKVKTGTANDNDYKNSGYDRGHLAPAGDMAYSEITMAESFYYSNMSPQLPGFNRGIWKRLESQVRIWASENENLYIITGPVLTNDLPTIGSNKVSVPNYYYKVVLDYTEPSIKAIGFIMSNNNSSEPLQNFAVSIDSVEKFTGIDFFPNLPDDQESLIEKTLCIKCWTWENSKSENKSKDENKLSASVQCKGITKSGEQCKNRTLNESGYCYLHESQNNASNVPSTPKEKTTETPTGTTKTGIPEYTGPRGGTYHYSKSGNKVYDKKK